MTNKLTCPTCNQAHTLNEYIQATDGEMAFNIALKVPPQLANRVLKYLQLFAPAKSVLTLNRQAKLIESMHLEGCDIGRVAFGIDKMLESHASGKLKTPLKNHNYLKQVMTSYVAPDEAEQDKYSLTDKQIKFIAIRLCNDTNFGMTYAEVGESSSEFLMRIEAELGNPKSVKNWYGYIEKIIKSNKI